MNASLRTLPQPGAVQPVREHGSSALDRVAAAWPAPDPIARIAEASTMRTGASAWQAPDPVMRFDLPAPDLEAVGVPIDRRIPWTDLVEPRYVVPVPDLHSASRAAVAAPIAVARETLPTSPFAAPITPPVATTAPQAWPAPTLADAAPVVAALPARKGTSATWATFGVAAAAFALAVGAVVLVAML